MPFFFPFNSPFYRRYNRYSNLENKHITNVNSQKEDVCQKKDSEIDESSESFFELFGLKLYFDDILIITLLFLLYNEKVKDTELFVCLILLLLS